MTDKRQGEQRASPSTDSPVEVISDRYVVEERIGRGGMAVVFRVRDRVTEHCVALKRMLRPRKDTSLEKVRMLFERECRTLAHLSHPRIVEVLDYGVDGDLPYYTMELLDGGDLAERTPRPWQETCALGRDVCSALSLVHARRMVYRDLSPRNVRCTSDGMAKLIDFGAIAPFGSARFAVCTPQVAAPEVVNLQPLDARADIYALGTTLYWTLTGRAPYPVRQFSQLTALWARPVAPPSSYVAGIPEALDELVMEMLNPELSARPASAAEVSERLTAIAGLDDCEDLVAGQAYLQTPELVGRDGELSLARARLRRLMEGEQGGSLLYRGPRGSGRSRLLDACLLNAKFDGLCVVRVGGNDASNERLGVANSLAEQLVDRARDAAKTAASDQWDLLASLLPALHGLDPDRPTVAPTSQALREGALPALRAWLLNVTKLQPLVVAIDDLERFDAESRNLISLLTEGTRDHPLLLLSTRCSDEVVECDAIRLLESNSQGVSLPLLEQEDARALVASVFGEGPSVALLANRLQQLANGKPKSLMQLMQHLVDTGAVRHQQGTWTLPERTADIALPTSMAEALSTIVAELGELARGLGQALSLGDEQTFAISDCVVLAHDCPNDGPPGSGVGMGAGTAMAEVHGSVLATLSELSMVGAVVAAGSGYGLAGPEWKAPLQAALRDDQRRELHGRLAEVFAVRGDGLRTADNLIRAGRPNEGIDALAKYSEETTALTDASLDAYLRFLEEIPKSWPEIYTRALELCQHHPEGKHVAYVMHLRLLGIFAQSSQLSNGHLEDLILSLAEQAGLTDWAALDPEMDAGQRLKQAIGQAAARHAALAENERQLDPITAIRHLARATLASCGYVANSLDLATWRRLPSIAPLSPLSPALSVVNTVAGAADARSQGRFAHATDLYRGLLARLDSPEEIGLEQTYVDGIRVGVDTVLGLFLAQLGDPEWEQRATNVETDPIHASNALLIRGVATVWQGNAAEAERVEHARQLLRLEYRRPQAYEGWALLFRFAGHAASDDLTRSRLALEAIERLANKAPGWKPVGLWARAEYGRIRGEHREALVQVEQGLAEISDRHVLWPCAATTRLLLLTSLGRSEDAQQQGEGYLALAAQAELGYTGAGLHMGVALAAAKNKRPKAAWGHVRAAIELLTAHRAGGVYLGLAYETAASVAIHLGDAEAFTDYAASCRALYVVHNNRALAAKYGRLVRAAKRTGLMATRTVGASESPAVTADLTSVLHSALSSEDTAAEKMHRALEVIVAENNTDAGYLITLVEGESRLLAQTIDAKPPVEILAAAQKRLAWEMQIDELTQEVDAHAVESAWADLSGTIYQPVVLLHESSEGFRVTGLIAMRSNVAPTTGCLKLAGHLSRFVAELAPSSTCA